MNAARAWIVAAVALVSLAPAATAATDAAYEVQGVQYLYLHGEAGRATFGSDASAESLLPFEGCAWAKLRPDKDLGRIQTIAKLQDVPFDVEFARFEGNGSQPGGIQQDVALAADGADPAVRAEAAAWGTATVRWDGVPFADPATESTTFMARWYVTDQAFRDDATGQVLAADGGLYASGEPARVEKGTREMHLRIASMPGGNPAGPVVTQQSRPQGPAPVIHDGAGHHDTLAFPNERFGGNGTLRIEAMSLAAPGQADLSFALLAPNGTVLDAVRLEPSAIAGAEHTFTFPLAGHGVYAVDVRGNATLASYGVTLEQRPPERFELDMWWDVVVPGYDGLLAREACDERIHGDSLAAYVPPRPDPPGFPWVAALFTVAGIATVLAVGVALLVATRAREAWRHASSDRP